jgi:hypothetical protein
VGAGAWGPVVSLCGPSLRGDARAGPIHLSPWVQGCSLTHVSKATLWEFVSFPETFPLWFTCGAGAAASASFGCRPRRLLPVVIPISHLRHRLFGDMLGPRVLGCRAVDRLPLLTHRMHPRQACAHGQRRPHHRSELRVQAHHQLEVIRVFSEQPQHVLGRARAAMHWASEHASERTEHAKGGAGSASSRRRAATPPPWRWRWRWSGCASAPSEVSSGGGKRSVRV